MSASAPLILRRAAEADIQNAVDHYLTEAGGPTALRFIDALERAFKMIAAHPGSGSPRYGAELDLPGLRAWRIRGFPHLIFYVERETHIDVWRVLHGARDMAAWLAGEEA